MLTKTEAPPLPPLSLSLSFTRFGLERGHSTFDQSFIRCPVRTLTSPSFSFARISSDPGRAAFIRFVRMGAGWWWWGGGRGGRKSAEMKCRARNTACHSCVAALPRGKGRAGRDLPRGRVVFIVEGRRGARARRG